MTAQGSTTSGDPHVVAIGWATVELDRAAVELADRLRPGATFEDAEPSEHLGAFCRIAPGPGSGPAIALLEPSTEGRLAATLARHGEGWLVTWVAEEGAPSGERSAERPGPFGPERLVLGGPASGPHVLVIRTATIDPP